MVLVSEPWCIHGLFQFLAFSNFQKLLIGNVSGASYTDKEVI